MTNISKKVMDQKAKVAQAQAEEKAKHLQDAMDRVFDVLREDPTLTIRDMLYIGTQLAEGSRSIFESQPLAGFLEDKK